MSPPLPPTLKDTAVVTVAGPPVCSSPHADCRPRKITCESTHTVQAYDRPVYFADDVTVQRHSSHSKSDKVDRSSTSTRKHKRRASFSDILPPHLIARASSPNDPSPPHEFASNPVAAYARGIGARGRGRSGPKSAPPLSPSRSPSPSPFEDEKKSPWWSPTAELPSLPPVPPPKTSSPVLLSEKEREQEQGLPQVRGGARLVLRVTTRMLGRTLDAVKGGLRSSEGQPGDDGWVVVPSHP